MNDSNPNQMTLDDYLPSRKTPLERILGFEAAEETYDLLTLREQLILDLLIEEWTQADIALLYKVKAPSISASVRRMRVKLAASKLRMILEARQMRRDGEILPL